MIKAFRILKYMYYASRKRYVWKIVVYIIVYIGFLEKEGLLCLEAEKHVTDLISEAIK